MELAFGAILGVLSSVAAWWILNHLLTPRIIFSPYISKKKNFFNKRGWIYMIKMKNTGSRSVIDVSYVAILRVSGLHMGNTTGVRIPLSYQSTPFIRRKVGNRILRLVPTAIPRDDLSFFPNIIRDKHGAGILTIADFFENLESAKLVIHVFCYDHFSGARKLFMSKEYMYLDIREGKFERHGLSIVPDESIVIGWTE